MSVKKPHPLRPRRERKLCPVCNVVSYSSNGLHPQCAVRQADSVRLERLKLARAADREVKPKEALAPWQKLCPKCHDVLHTRKRTCACGYEFVASKTGGPIL